MKHLKEIEYNYIDEIQSILIYLRTKVFHFQMKIESCKQEILKVNKTFEQLQDEDLRDQYYFYKNKLFFFKEVVYPRLIKEIEENLINIFEDKKNNYNFIAKQP